MWSDEIGEQKLPENTNEYIPNPEYGRTGWDVLFMGRKVFAIIILLIVAVVVMYIIGTTYGVDVFKEIVTDYWPAFLSPLVGWYLGKKIVAELYKPAGRMLVMLNVEHHLLRVIFVPEETYRLMKQTGNNVVYHTMGGLPVYIVEDLDLMTGNIDYGWVHDLDPLVVMTRENAYLKWDETLKKVLEENLELLVHPHVIGLGYARTSLRNHLNGIGRVMGFKDVDLEQHSLVKDGSEQNNDIENRNEGGGQNV